MQQQTCQYLASGSFTCSSGVEEHYGDAMPPKQPRQFAGLLNKLEAAGVKSGSELRLELAKCEHYFVLVSAHAKSGQIHTLEGYYARAQQHFGMALTYLDSPDIENAFRQVYTKMAMRARDSIDAAVNRAAAQGYAHQVGLASTYLSTARRVNKSHVNKSHVNNVDVNGQVDLARQRAARAIRVCSYVNHQSDVPRLQQSRCKDIIRDASALVLGQSQLQSKHQERNAR